MRKLVIATMIIFCVLVTCSVLLTAPRADVALAQGDDWCATCVVQNSDCITESNALATDLWATRQAPATGTPTTGPDLVATVAVAEPASQHAYAVICNIGDVAVPTESHVDAVYFPSSFINADTGETIDDAWIDMSDMDPGVCATVSSADFGYEMITAQDYAGRGYVNVYVVANTGSLGFYDETFETDRTNNASNVVKADLPTATPSPTPSPALSFSCVVEPRVDYDAADAEIDYEFHTSTAPITTTRYWYVDELLVRTDPMIFSDSITSAYVWIPTMPVWSLVDAHIVTLRVVDDATLASVECSAPFGAPVDVEEVHVNSAGETWIYRREVSMGDDAVGARITDFGVPVLLVMVVGGMFAFWYRRRKPW